MPERAIIQVDFSGGTDEHTDARHVVPGKLLSLKNGVFEKMGAIRKRRGYAAIPRTTLSGATVTTGLKLCTLQNELVLHAGDTVYSLASAAQRWVAKDAAPLVFARRSPVLYSPASLVDSFETGIPISPDVAYGNGYLIQAWTQNRSLGGNQVCVTVTEVSTGANLFSSFALVTGVTGALTRVVVLGNTAYVLWTETVGALIRCRTLDLTNPSTWTAATILAFDLYALNEDARFDACALSDRIVVVYTNNTAGDRVSLRSFNASLVQLASGTIAGTTGDIWDFAIRGLSGERLWLAYGAWVPTTLTLRVATLNTSTLAVVSSGTVVGPVSITPRQPVGIERIDASTAVVTWQQTAISQPRTARYAIVNTSITTLGSGLLWRYHWTSRPFVAANPYSGVTECYALVTYDHGFSPTAPVTATSHLVRLPTASVADQVPDELARIAPELSIPPTDTKRIQSSVAALGGGRYAMCTLTRSSQSAGVDTAIFDFQKRDFSDPTELGSSLHFPNGVPCAYDGAGVVETSFSATPIAPTYVSQSTGSGLIANGTYNYLVVFTRYDVRGQVYRSTPSLPVSVTVSGASAGANKVTLHITTLTLTRATDQASTQRVVPSVYRTKAGGSTFYELAPSMYQWGPALANLPGPIINDPTVYQVVLEDAAGDSELDGQPLLYTTGNILPNSTAPSASVQVVHKDRLWLAGTDEPKVLWFSKQRVFGEGIGFNPFLTLTVEDGGGITALGSLDSHLIIFKADRLFYVDGDGPPDTGGEGFSPPQRISADVGCIEPRSVALTPEGLFFQSSAGIYLLDRGLGLSYVSGPVEDTLAAYPIITSAIVHDSQFHVRFSCTNTSGSLGVVLVLDYLTKQWSVFELQDVTTGNLLAPVVSACNFGGAYTWVTNNGGALYTESSTSYTDAGLWVTLSLETSWLKVAGLQGWQRAWSVSLLGERYTPHDLVISVGNDYASAYHQTKTWSDAAIATMPLEQIRTALVRQKCQALRFKFSDAPPTGGGVPGTGRGLSFTGIAIEAAVLKKTKRLGAAQRG